MASPTLTRFLILLLLISLPLKPVSAQLNSPAASTPADQITIPPASTPSPSPSSSQSTTQSTPASSPSSTPSTTPPVSTSSTSSSSSSINPVSSTSSHSSVSTSSSSLSSSSASSSQKQSQSSTVVVVTVTSTGADGSVYTSVTSSYTPLPRPTSTQSNNDSSGLSSGTWAIIGGVVGGLAGIAAVVFIVFRCTQKRFSDLDDEDVAIKWPELVNRTDDPTTLNPLAARPGVGHGIGEDEENDEKPGLYSHDIAMEPLHSDQRHPGMYDSSYRAYHQPMHPQDHQAYYDPYLGPSAAQQPFPASVNNLGYDEMGYQQTRGHELQAHPSHSSSVTMGGGGHDVNSPSAPYRAPSRQRDHSNKNDQFHDDSAYWDGPEDIPLSVVNSAGSAPQNSHPQHQ